MESMNKNYWKKLSNELTEYANPNDWKKSRSIKISHTSLFPIHSVGRGPNSGEPTLLDFNTKLIEASAIYFHYIRKYNSIEIYVNSKTNYADKTFFEIRKKNKNTIFTYFHRRNDADQDWFVRDVAKTANLKWYDVDTFKLVLISQGYSIVTEFSYTDEVQFKMPHHNSGIIHPKYIKRSKNTIEIGWLSSGTYNSIPNVIKIEKTKGLNTKLLRDLGIEGKGYYDGHYRCEILSSQAEQATKFFKSKLGLIL